jgi:hypothetical protein
MSYKMKNRFLLASILLFGVLAYLVALKPTVELYYQNQESQELLSNIDNAPAYIGRMERQLESYSKAVEAFSKDSTKEDQFLLERLAKVCHRNQILLAAFPPAKSYREGGYEIESRLVKLRGAFPNLLRVLYDLEHNQPVGRITGVKIVLEDERKTKQTHLFAYFYVQNLKGRQNEE